MKIKLNLTTKITGVALLAIVLMAFNGKSSDLQEHSKKSAIVKKKKPNIIFLLTDDQRYNALGCMGNEEIQTPIDKLAEQGIVFTNNYNNTAICMGSRASIVTGMYEHKTGCNFTHSPLSKKFQKSYPVLLKCWILHRVYCNGFAVKETGLETVL